MFMLSGEVILQASDSTLSTKLHGSFPNILKLSSSILAC